MKHKTCDIDRKRFKSEGQLLVEAMVAIGLVVIGLLGVFALLSQSLGLRRVVSERYIATYLAAEGVELVKNIIDTNYIQGIVWNQGIDSGDYLIDYDGGLQPTIAPASPLLYNESTGIYSYNSGNPTRFKRLINITLSSDGENITVNSIVDWQTRGGGEFSVNLEDHFYNWR
jgi:hypothetical protein